MSVTRGNFTNRQLEIFILLSELCQKCLVTRLQCTIEEIIIDIYPEWCSKSNLFYVSLLHHETLIGLWHNKAMQCILQHA